MTIAAADMKRVAFTLHNEELPDEEAQLMADAVNHYRPRRLCMAHHCQEFDKLPNIQRYRAAYWQTVGVEECEICQEHLETSD